jgi:hypothetical protein
VGSPTVRLRPVDRRESERTEYVEPDLLRSSPWPEIAAWYGELEAEDPRHRAMARLAARIGASRYGAGLYGAISLDALLVAQTPRFSLYRELLRIYCDGARVHFEFVEGAFSLPWRHTCPAEHAFAELERFLVETKRWFPRER